MDIILAIILSYLIGSISPSWFFGKLKGIDVREKGVKNVGAYNTIKLVGIIPGVITGIFDIAKGVLAIFIATNSTTSLFLVYLVGLAAIVGHNFPFHLRFKGGYGVAVAIGTIIGALIWNLSWILIILLFITEIFFFVLRYRKNIRKRKK